MVRDSRLVATVTTLATTVILASCRWSLVRCMQALIMVAGYGLYIVFMIFNSRILAMFSAPRVRLPLAMRTPNIIALICPQACNLCDLLRSRVRPVRY